MSTTKLTIAVLLIAVASVTTAIAQRTVSGSMSTYTASLNTPVDGDFIGRYDAPIHFSGAVDTGGKTVYVQVRNENGSWSNVTTTRSSQNSLYPGQFRWSVNEALNLSEWEFFDFYGVTMYGETTVRAITYKYVGWHRISNVLGEATIHSASWSL